VRRGTSNVEPSLSELQDLYNTFGLILTEERLVPGTHPADVDVENFRRYLARNGIARSDDDPIALETDLYNREILDRDLDGEWRATLYGVLCFGKHPQEHGPTRGFWVDLVAYAGNDRADPVLLSGEARGRLDEQVERAESWLRALGRTEHYAGLERVDRWVVPLAAFRECVVNAVAHRDYAILGSRVLVEVFDDRVAITSPGALPNHKRPESVLAGGSPRSRNEAMANYLLTMGLMEQRGSGMPRVVRAMQAFNGTRPELHNDKEERWFRVTLKR
jgi:predicted HTH transcriptional regulator